jgi:ribosomal protein S18 acetylase RimI-like enzyme
MTRIDEHANRAVRQNRPMTQIRPLADADIDAVAEVHVRTWQSAYAGIVPAEVLDALDPAVNASRRRARPAPPGTATLVADDDGTILGFVAFGPSRVDQGDEYDFSTGELYAIYVHPDHQGAGTGRRLITAAREALTKAGFPEMRLWVLTENHPARRFYERLGLTPDGETHHYTPRGSTAELPEIRYAVRL